MEACAQPGLRDRLLPVYAVGVAALLWGAWWIPLRVLDERGLTGDWASAALGLGAAAVVLPVAIARRRRLYAGGWNLLWVGLFAGAAFAAFNHGLIHGLVVRAVLLFYLSPVWATLLGIAFLGERVGRLRIFTVIAGIAGAAIVLGNDGALPVPRTGADWMGLGAGVLWSCAMVFVRKTQTVSAFEKTFAALVGSGLCALALALVAGPASASVPGAGVFAAALPLTLAAVVIWLLPMTFIEWWWAPRMDPGRVCIVLLLEIVAASATAAALTDEPFGWRELAGSTLIVAAGLIEMRDQARSGGAP